MPLRPYVNPGQNFVVPDTQNGQDMSGPAVVQPGVAWWLFPRLGRDLTPNDSLPYQQQRSVEMNSLFALLPFGHG